MDHAARAGEQRAREPRERGSESVRIALRSEIHATQAHAEHAKLALEVQAQRFRRRRVSGQDVLARDQLSSGSNLGQLERERVVRAGYLVLAQKNEIDATSLGAVAGPSLGERAQSRAGQGPRDQEQVEIGLAALERAVERASI